MTILFTSAGRRNQLLSCFRRDAAELGLRIRILTADLRPELSSACQQSDAWFKVPRCDSGDYIPALLGICRREQVRLLVPTIDTELATLAARVADFAALGCRVAVSDPATIALARDKLETARVLLAAGVDTPRTASLAEYRAEPGLLPGPVIAKPRGGSSSVGIVRGQRPADFTGLAEAGYLIQELWQGREYTVNLFFNTAGMLCCAVPHERIEVRSGEVSKGTTRRLLALEEAARRLAKALPGAAGALCFQAVVTATGEYAVFEINARFGGGYPLAHRAGARFSQWLLEETVGLPCTAHNNWKEGVTMLRYDEAVFLDE